MDSRLRGNDGARLCRFGESVAHSKFGEGVIVNIEGSGGNARAQMKALDLSVAKLERVAR
ncbi:hypothetical protein [Massilia soli]|uniref:DNA helicase II n=1 Tax=Massilia soli TaxID=2792854 RepID=A0ABS7SSK4_9BURK|nr:hypothetical protein [Massilia soli]MBZ2208910.1 hypothetical protein [Massilia soli]